MHPVQKQLLDYTKLPQCSAMRKVTKHMTVPPCRSSVAARIAPNYEARPCRLGD
jgi:hypothetical protein